MSTMGTLNGRKQHSAETKAKVVIAAIKGQHTASELASMYGVHATQIGMWKKKALEELVQLFSSRRSSAVREQEDLTATLYQQIGQLKVELDWLKKKSRLTDNEGLRKLIEPGHVQISLQRQCELVGLVRSMWYYEPKPVDPEDLRLKRLLDEQYMRTPFYGVLRMTEWLKRLKEIVNVKRVRRLLREMGLEALYPKRNLSKPAPGHKIYPYLLRGLAILRPNQVWSTDITYIRLKQGFVYLVAVIDWHSRYVLSWGLSVTMESNFCIEALDQAIRLYGVPDIFNTDQGSQFTCIAFTNLLKAVGAQISMDGRGRALDNVFVERLWRSVKYEEVFLHDYATVEEAMEGLKKYFHFYNTERLHQSLDYKTPQEVYEEQETGGIRTLCAA